MAIIIHTRSVGCGIYDHSVELWLAATQCVCPCGGIGVAAERNSPLNPPSHWEGLIVPLLPLQPYETLVWEGWKTK